MKTRLLHTMFLCLIPFLLTSQSIPDSNLVNRYYFTAKVWGYLKYFHSEVAKGKYNWDAVLIQALPRVKLSANDQEFNSALAALIDTAGTMAIPNTSAAVVADSLKYNLDLRWLSDPIFSPAARSALDTIRSRFRPQSNYYVGRLSNSQSPNFNSDTLFYSIGYQPSEGQWLLSLFRYWNIINYFAPDKNLIDQNWDDVLKEFIPKVLRGGEDDYQLAMIELTTRINDSHAFVLSPKRSQPGSEYFLPIRVKYIDGETVISRVRDSVVAVKPGDIIRAINGVDTRAWRDSIRRYAAGSNTGAIESLINSFLVGGTQNSVAQLEIENGGGLKTVSLTRSDDYWSTFNGMLQTTPTWRKIRSPDSLTLFGYVDMERLVSTDVAKMFADLRDADAIIFDLRRYPQGSAVSEILRYLVTGPSVVSWFTVPDVQYPGTLHWTSTIAGYGSVTTGGYKKEVRVLMNEGTVSYGEYTIMNLELHRPLMKFGSQSNGADGSVSYIYLPGMIQTGFSGLGVFYPDGRPTQRIGIVPDVIARPTIAGLRQGRDEVLEAALQYKLQTAVSVQGSVSLIGHPTLFQNYPNPFNGATRILYSIPQAGIVKLKVFDVLGRELGILVAGYQASGSHSVVFDFPNWPSGIYFSSLEVDGRIIEQKKMVCVR